MIEVPIDDPKRVKEIFMHGDGKTVAALGKPATTDTPTRAVEQQISIQQDIISDLHAAISALGARLEKITVSCPVNGSEKQAEQETLSPVAEYIRTNNESLCSAVVSIRHFTDEIQI